METTVGIELTYQQRLDALHEKKLQVTKEKQEIIGAMNYDDWNVILPPEEVREVTRAMSGSGIMITDVLLKGVEMESNHPSGGFFGAEIVGKNFRRFLEAHPAYIDPLSALAGGYMAHFYSYRKVGWPEELRYPRYDEHAALPPAPRRGRAEPFLPGPADRPGPGLGRHPEQDSPLPRGERSGACRVLQRPGARRPRHAELDPAQRRPGARAGADGGEPPVPPELCGTGRDQPAPGERAAAHLPRGLPVDHLVPDDGPHVLRLGLARPARYAAHALL